MAHTVIHFKIYYAQNSRSFFHPCPQVQFLKTTVFLASLKPCTRGLCMTLRWQPRKDHATINKAYVTHMSGVMHITHS